MQFTTKTVRSNTPRLTQEEALDSLYARFGSDIRVASIRPDGDYWVAAVKLAEFPPPKKDEGEGGPVDTPEDSGPPDSDDDDDSGSDYDGAEKPSGPPSGDEKEKGKGGAEHEILGLLKQIADALGVAPPMHDKMVPGGEPPLPGGGGHPAPGGPPSPGLQPPLGGPAPARRPTKLKPGEVLPTQTPIGTPAFSSSRTANTCPNCGGATGPDGSCPTCGQNYGAGGAAGAAPPATGHPVVGRVATFTATLETDMSIKEAKTDLEREYSTQGYKVKQIKEARNNAGRRELRALLSVR